MRWAAAKRWTFSFLAVSRPRDRGTSMVELGTAVALVAMVTTAVIAAVPGQVTDLVDNAVCSVGTCADESAEPGPDGENAESNEVLPTATPSEPPPERPQPRDLNEDTIVCFRAPCP